MPIGDTLGVGYGVMNNLWSLPLAMSPRDGRAFNCFFAMPFAERAHIEASNYTTERLALYLCVDRATYPSARRGVRADIQIGGSVLIIGADPIGLATLLSLPPRGPKAVLVSKMVAAPKQLARRLGTTPVSDSSDGTSDCRSWWPHGAAQVWSVKWLRYLAHSYGPAVLSMRFFSQGKLQPKSIITDKAQLTHIQQAIESLLEPTYQVKTLVQP